jgi:hypothetical protein
MLKTAIPVLASLNEKETVKFYTEKLGSLLISGTATLLCTAITCIHRAVILIQLTFLYIN